MGSVLSDENDGLRTDRDMALALVCGFLTPDADIVSAVAFMLNIWKSDRFTLEEDFYLFDKETNTALLHHVLAELFEPADTLARQDNVAMLGSLIIPAYRYPDRILQRRKTPMSPQEAKKQLQRQKEEEEAARMQKKKREEEEAARKKKREEANQTPQKKQTPIRTVNVDDSDEDSSF